MYALEVSESDQKTRSCIAKKALIIEAITWLARARFAEQRRTIRASKGRRTCPFHTLTSYLMPLVEQPTPDAITFSCNATLSNSLSR